MTDKQIIYNCPHISHTDWGTYACKLYNPRDKNCLVVGGNCDSNVGCPYKQLKRKEQECEELKNFHINLVGVKECKIRELVKYKQALAEIKEIAEKCDMPPCLEDGCDCVNCKDDVTENGAKCMQYGLLKILQKISEVLDE